jgi:hypothetical protein
MDDGGRYAAAARSACSRRCAERTADASVAAS